MRLKCLIDISVCALLLGPGLCHAQDGGALKLWHRQPAGAWTQALPVGNGRLAAMVFGTVRKEHIQLNEDTVWSGEKRDRSNPEHRVARQVAGGSGDRPRTWRRGVDEPVGERAIGALETRLGGVTYGASGDSSYHIR